MEEKRKTKKEYFTEIKDLLVEKGEDRLAEVIDKEIALLDKKAMKSKERAAQRKAEGDELRDTISGILTEELQTAEEILEQIDDEEITKAKVVARLTQLISLGEAEKEQVKLEDGKRMAYRRA